MDCIFCKIAQKEVDCDCLYEDDEVIAFSDLNPGAPHHKLIIPKQHIPTINDLSPENYPLVGKLFGVAKKVAHDLGIAESGYRLVFNVNRDAGQEVFHIHLHLLGGRQLQWPPG